MMGVPLLVMALVLLPMEAVEAVMVMDLFHDVAFVMVLAEMASGIVSTSILVPRAATRMCLSLPLDAFVVV